MATDNTINYPLTVEELNMRMNLPVLAALVAGGVLLSKRMHQSRLSEMASGHTLSRMPHLALSRTRGPALTLEETLVLRPRAPATLATLAALLAGGWFAWKKLGGSEHASSVQESVVLDVPVRTAYNQWTQFEQFPQFMASVKEVKQIDNTHLHWRADVAGKTKEWDAEITEQIPDERIAWRSTGGVKNAGVVTFHKLSDSRTKVMLQMDYDPETIDEKLGDAVGGVRLTTRGNLNRFKKLVESRGTETGAWRGTVAQH